MNATTVSHGISRDAGPTERPHARASIREALERQATAERQAWQSLLGTSTHASRPPHHGGEHRAGEHREVEHRAVDHLHADPRVQAYWQQYAPRSDGPGAFARDYVDIASDLAQRGGVARVWDLGCAWGVQRALLPAALDYIGVDHRHALGDVEGEASMTSHAAQTIPFFDDGTSAHTRYLIGDAPACLPPLDVADAIIANMSLGYPMPTMRPAEIASRLGAAGVAYVRGPRALVRILMTTFGHTHVLRFGCSTPPLLRLSHTADVY